MKKSWRTLAEHHRYRPRECGDTTLLCGGGSGGDSGKGKMVSLGRLHGGGMLTSLMEEYGFGCWRWERAEQALKRHERTGGQGLGNQLGSAWKQSPVPQRRGSPRGGQLEGVGWQNDVHGDRGLTAPGPAAPCPHRPLGSPGDDPSACTRPRCCV